MPSVAKRSAWLIPLPGGPPLAPLELQPLPQGLVLGRHENCPVRLPPEADKVSRQHVRFVEQDGKWRISDLRSRWGTFLNGVKLTPGRDFSLGDGDLVRIVPWTFNFSTTGASVRGLRAVDDVHTSTTLVRSLQLDRLQPLQDDLLNLLLESAAGIHAAQDESTLASVLMDIACRGTGLPNAAVLRALDDAGHIEVVSTRTGPSLRPAEGALFSRSLLAAAAQGVAAEVSAAGTADISQSMVQMQLDAAICVPLMLGSTVAAYLYLDSRGSGLTSPRTLRPNASAFCFALANMAGLALANLKRLEIERRSAVIEAELSAAVTAQRWILPQGITRAGPFECVGESKAGEYLGGDFFDTLVLPDGQLVVTLGDVSGHGIAASVLMTASQGFLHAALASQTDLARAVEALNVFLHDRRPEGKFVTLWVGLFDPASMTVSYVDAGHGYAMLIDADNMVTQLAAGDGLPVAVLPDSAYQVATAALPPGGRVVIISDGLAEQFEGDTVPGTPRKQFGSEGIHATLTTPCEGDPIAHLFQSVYQFAGTESLSDDATAVLVKW